MSRRGKRALADWQNPIGRRHRSSAGAGASNDVAVFQAGTMVVLKWIITAWYLVETMFYLEQGPYTVHCSDSDRDTTRAGVAAGFVARALSEVSQHRLLDQMLADPDLRAWHLANARNSGFIDSIGRDPYWEESGLSTSARIQIGASILCASSSRDGSGDAISQVEQ